MLSFEEILGWILVFIGLVGLFFCFFASGGFFLGVISTLIIFVGRLLTRFG